MLLPCARRRSHSMEMVGMRRREQAMAALDEGKHSCETLLSLKDILLEDPSLASEFLPKLLHFHAHASTEVRTQLIEILAELGSRHFEYIRVMVPILISLLHDEIPTVARNTVACGTNLFWRVLEQVAAQGVHSGYVDKALEESWLWLLKFKDAVYSAAFQHGNGALRCLALKFVETTILLFTPDPNSPSQPPPLQGGTSQGFNVAWIIGGHPVLDAGALGQESSRNLSLLVDQLRPPEVSKLPVPVMVVLIYSLASIARKRSSLYGRILPVLLGLGSSCEAMKGSLVASVAHALKSSFLSLLKCTHPGATPWRERLVSSLKVMNAGEMAEAAVRQTDRMLRNAEKERALGESRFLKDEKTHAPMWLNTPTESGRKRAVSEDEDDSAGGKRLRLTFPTRTTPLVSSKPSTGTGQDASLSSLGETKADPGQTKDDPERSQLQQIIALIGALVAKGDRAASSIDLLISKLEPDMLADVVMENMKNLPATAPLLPSTTVTSPASSAAGLSPLSPTSSPTLESPTLAQPASDLRRDPRRDPRRMDPRRAAVPVGLSQSSVPISQQSPVKTEELAVSTLSNMALVAEINEQNATVAEENVLAGTDVCDKDINRSTIEEVKMSNCDPPVCESSLDTDSVLTPMDTGSVPSDNLDTVPNPLDMPSVPLDKVSETDAAPANHSFLTDLQTTHLASSSGDAPIEVASSTPTEVLRTDLEPTPVESLIVLQGGGEAHDSLAVVPVASAVSPQCLLSTAAVVELTTLQQEALNKEALLRILQGRKEISASGSGELRLALLARLVSQSSGDEEILNLLQKHIVTDYQNHKGHELTMHILYMLYTAEISASGVRNSSTAAVSMYEKFLLSVVYGLRDNLPALDKSLSRLLGEAPLLPEAVLQFLHTLCNPTVAVKGGLQNQQGDRVTQGLRAVWSLIMLRPPVRIRCLDIVMQCTVHELDDVRTKAIFLAVKKLFPLSHVSQRIEDFALRMLHSVLEQQPAEEVLRDVAWSEQATWQIDHSSIKVEGENQSQSNGEQSYSESSLAADDQVHAVKGSVSLTDASRRLSLFLALCSKKYALLGRLFSAYGCAPKSVRQAIHRHMPILLQTTGSSVCELLQIIADPPSGSKNLVLQVLHILTEAAEPSSELLSAVKQLYETKLKDATVLIPVLSSLSKDEVLPIFPRLVGLPIESFKIALARILQGSVHSVPALTPAEVLIAIHEIDPDRDSVPLTKVKDACSVCFQQRTVFTQQVLKKAIDHLVERSPLPMLFMRTVIQTVGSFRALVDFVMEILSRLVSKQIWRSPKLWVGFLKCAEQTQPHSYNVLLQLPAPQLEKALHRHPSLRPPLSLHASQPHIRPALLRPSLVVLGLAQEISIPPLEAVLDTAALSHGKETPTAESTSVT